MKEAAINHCFDGFNMTFRTLTQCSVVMLHVEIAAIDITAIDKFEGRMGIFVYASNPAMTPYRTGVTMNDR